MKFAILYYPRTAISYDADWVGAFLKSGMETTAFNCGHLGMKKLFGILKRFDYIVLLHSTNSDGVIKLPVLFQLSGAFNLRKGKVIYFVGNEFKAMARKIRFATRNNIDYIVSQLPQDSADWLYSGTKAKIISLPHALNPDVFKPAKPFAERAIHIGNRSRPYPWYLLGDMDRDKILASHGKIKHTSPLTVDIATENDKALPREQWAAFLNNCKFTLSSEAGSSFLRKDEETEKKVIRYINRHKNVTFEEVYTLFFKNMKNSVSGKCVSSRHFDAIGTKTCQILLEGRYNNILKPNEHYIELKKDFSNMDEVQGKMQDEHFVNSLVDHAYEFVLSAHTHKHRIEKLLHIITK